MYLLEDALANRRLTHRYVAAVEYPGGSIEVQADRIMAPYRKYDRIANIDHCAEVDNMGIAHAMSVARMCHNGALS